jgi:hypothetical protein
MLLFQFSHFFGKVKMKIAFTLLLTLCLPFWIFAQEKRNVIHLGGLFYDHMLLLNNREILEESQTLEYTDRMGFSAGYDRVIGSSIMVGLRYSWYIGTGKQGIECNNSFMSAPIKALETTDSYTLDYVERGGGFSYESRFFFEEVDKHYGFNSITNYIGVMFSRITLREALVNINAYDVNHNSIPVNDVENKYSINRLGIKLGGFMSDYVSVDYYVAGYANFVQGKGDKFTPLSTVPDFSFAIGCLIGVPF